MPHQQAPERPESQEEKLELRPIVKYIAIGLGVLSLLGVEYATYRAGVERGYKEGVCSGEVTAAVHACAVENLRHVQQLGLTPHLVLGDFDSLGYCPEGAEVHPVEKDDTDAMLAVRRGLELGYREFWLYGALDGPRLDHTVANFQTLQFLADRGANGYLIGSRQLVTVVKDGALTFPETAEGDISLFCLGEAARGVTITGLKYELEKGSLEPGFPLGVSNHFIGRPGKITVEKGSLLVIFDRKNGFLWK